MPLPLLAGSAQADFNQLAELDTSNKSFSWPPTHLVHHGGPGGDSGGTFRRSSGASP